MDRVSFPPKIKYPDFLIPVGERGAGAGNETYIDRLHKTHKFRSVFLISVQYRLSFIDISVHLESTSSLS